MNDSQEPLSSQEQLRQRLRELLLPLRTIAEKSGVSVTSLSLFQNGKQDLSFQNYERLKSWLDRNDPSVSGRATGERN